MALAMIVTSIQYTPKTVEAAEDYSGLEFTEVTAAGFDGFAYSIINNTLGYGAPEFWDNGITMQLVYSADYKANDTVVKINGETTTVGDIVTTVSDGLTKFNPGKFEDNAYTHIAITSTNGAGTELVIRRGNPTPEVEEIITLPIEAENATIAGNAVVNNDADASNRQFVGNVGAGNAGTLTFTVQANTAGTYNMKIYQFQADTRSIAITVNGNNAGTLACTNTGSWNPPATADTVEIALNEGANTIQFAGVEGAYAPNIDKIEIDLLESEAEATVEALISTLNVDTLTESDADKAKVKGIQASYNALPDKSGVANADVLEQAYNKVNGIIVLEAPEDIVLYNYRQTDEGYKVVFDDPNTVTVGEGETYAYEVYVENGGNQLIGTVSASEEFITADAIDALGLGENGNYAVYIKAVLTQADGTRVESEAGRGDITYRTSTTTTQNTGIPQIIIQTANNSVNLLTDTSKKKADSTIIVNDAEGNLIHSDFGTANTRGNSTVYADKKAYNFKFDSNYDLLGLGKAKKFSLLANAFDKSLLRNKLAMDLGNAMGIPYNSSSTFVDVYVDGKYLGNYLLIESIEEGEERVNIDSENDKEYNSNVLLELENSGRNEEGCTYITTSTYGERFVMGSPEKADDITEDFFAQKVTDTTNALNAFEKALASNDYAAFSTLMDVESFVNFYIVTEFFKQQDIAFSSTRFFIQDGKLYAGPLWDFDLSSGNLNTGYYTADDQSPEGYHTTVNKWFNALMQNATFKRLVKERFNEMLPTIKSLYEGEGNTIDALLAEMGTSAALNYTSTAENGAGWNISAKDSGDGYSYANSYNFSSYEESVEHFRKWLADRTAFLEEEWAIDDTEDAQYEEWISSKIYNMALGKTVTPYKRVNEGDIANINDGKISLTETAPTCAALAPGDAGWEQAGSPVYATIDLGAYYDASTIDKIFIQYKDNAENDTVVGKSYIVQYSTDNVNFYDAVPEKNVSSLDAVQRYTVNDVSAVTGAVRYVRVYYPTTPNYGIQISEIAILDTDGNAAEVEQVTLDVPTGFTAASDSYNAITATVTGEGQDGYTYNILVDGEVVKTGVQPGETVTITGIAEGTHNVTAVSAKDGWYSAATEAVAVDVKAGFTWNRGQVGYTKADFGIEDLTIDGTEYYNYSRYTGVSASATVEDMPAAYAIDGNVDLRWASSASDPHSITVNLGNVYTVKAIAALWETASSKDFTVEVSTDGTTFTPVATIENAPAGAERYDLITLTDAVEAQYVRITGTSRTTVWGHSLWELGIYGPDPYEAGEVVEKPAAPGGLVYAGNPDLLYYWAWQPVVGATSYEFYVNGELVGSTPGTAFNVTDATIFEKPGDYTIGVKAVNEAGESEMTTLGYTVTEKDPVEYTYYKMEAEDAVLTGGAVIVDAENSSNKKIVGAVGGGNNGTITFTIDADVAGERTLHIYYSTLGDRTFNVVVNGETTIPMTGASTNAWYVPSATPLEVTVTLKEGKNTIQLTGDGSDAPNMDCIEIQLTEDEIAAMEGTEEPTEPDITDWVKVTGTSKSNATVWMSQAVVNTLNAGLLGYYAGGTVNDGWGNLGDTTNMYNTPYFGFVTTGGNATSITIEGTEYTSDDQNVYIGGDCVFINQDLVDAQPGETKYYTITATGTTTGSETGTFIIKVVGEQAPDISGVTVPGDDGWTEVTGGAGAADGSTWYLPTDTSVVTTGVRELENTGADVEYGGVDNTLTVPVLGFSVGTGWPVSIWVAEEGGTSVKLNNEQVFLNTDVISIAQSVFPVETGETKIFYVTARNTDGSDHTFPVKIVGPEPTETWSDWVAINDESGADKPTIDYYYSTSSFNTISMGTSRELPNTVLIEFGEGLGSVKSDSVEFTYGGAAVEIKKSELVEGQEYILEVTNVDGTKAGQVKIKYEPAPSLAPSGIVVSTNRGDIESTTDDTATVSWVNSDDAIEEGCSYVIQLKSGDEVLATVNANSSNATAGLDLSAVEYGTYDVVITTYDSEGNEVDTQTVTYKYLDPYAVDSEVNFNNTLWEKFRWQTITWTKVEAATGYAIYADGVLVGTTTDFSYNVDAYNFANGTNASGQPTTVGDHTTTVVAIFEGDAVPETLDAVNTDRVMGTNEFPLNVNYVYGHGTDIWNNTGVDSVWNFTISENIVGEITEGANVGVEYDASGAANLTIVDNGTHTGVDQEWTIKAAIYDEAVLEGEKINLSFDIVGPAELVDQKITIKCCSEEVDDNGVYTGAEAIYEEAAYTFEALKDEEGNVIGSIIHYSNSFDSTNDSYDLLFGLGELGTTELTLTDASMTKVYGVTSVSGTGITNPQARPDEKEHSMYISWTSNVPDPLKDYYTYSLVVKDADGNVVIEDENATSGITHTGLATGTYTIEVSSIYDGTVTATVSTEAYIDPNQASKPDLVVSNIELKDISKDYHVGEQVTFVMTMTNVGTETATITGNEIVGMLHVTDKNGTMKQIGYAFVAKDGETDTASIAPRAEAQVEVVYTISDDDHTGDYLFTITGQADERNMIDELNEENNYYTKVFKFYAPLQVVTLTNDGTNIKAEWPAHDDTNAKFVLSYVDAVTGNVIQVETAGNTPSITFPEGTLIANNSPVEVISVHTDGSSHLYATGTALADLIIEYIEIDGGLAYVGESKNFVATVKNIGVAVAEGAEQIIAVKFTNTGVFDNYGTVDNQVLNPNETFDITVTGYTPTVVGNTTLNAWVDDAYRIAESNEENNYYEIVVPAINKGTIELANNDGTVSAEWTDPNTDLTATGYKLTYTNADGEVKSVDVDDVTTYTFDEFLKNNTDVSISAKYEEFGDVYYQLASTKALADLIVEDIVFPLEAEGVLYTRRPYDIEVVFKNIGTADVPATGNDITQHYGWWIIEQLTANSDKVSFGDGAYSIDGLKPGASDSVSFKGVTISEEGTYDFTAKVDYPNFSEVEVQGFIAESDESNNSRTESVDVAFKQNTDTEWTRFVSAGFIGEPAEGELYLFPVASGSQQAYIDYKILDTTVDYLDWQDLITRYVGYQGANMSVAFNGTTGEDVINYLPEENGVAVSDTVVEFAQVPEWNEFVEDENGNVIYDDDGNPLETTPDPNSKDLCWIDLATKSAIIVDENGNHLQEPETGDSPITYNGNGINFFVGNFGLYKCYILKFTTPVMNEDGTQATDENGNPVYDYTTVAFRVTDDKIRTNNWMQALQSDGVSDPNTLPIPYCGGDSWVAGMADAGTTLVGAKHESITENFVDNTDNTDNEHEDTEASQNYETIGALWYDASDIMLSSISVYNGNWLSVATSQYLDFDSGDQDNNGNKKFRVGIARANTIPEQNNAFIQPEDDPNFDGFVVTDPNKESAHLGIQGTNTVHIGLPWLLQELPTHSDIGGQKDTEYYWIRIWADIENPQETIRDADGNYEQLANYIDVPITIYYNVPMIEEVQNASAQFTVDANEQNTMFNVMWSTSDHQNAYGYTYKIFAGDTQIGETYDSAQSLSFNYAEYEEAIVANDNKLKIVAYWCEQEIATEVEIQPEKEMGWYDIDGESSITIQAGQKKLTELPGQMRFYYERANNHSTIVAGYNGHYIALNGNIQWFNQYSQVYVANDPFWSENEGKDPEQTEHNDGTEADGKGIAYNDLEATYFEGKTEGVDYNKVETYMGSTTGQIQILAKNLFSAKNQDSYYVAKVVSPVLVEVPVAEGSVATTWVPAVEVAEGTDGAVQYEEGGAWYVAAVYDEAGNVTNGEIAYNEPVYIRFHSTVDAGNVELKGFQMNTDYSAGAVSEKSPSFRVVSRAAKVVFNYEGEGSREGNPLVEAVVKQGTIYALASDAADTTKMTIAGYDDATGEYALPEGIYVQEATEEYGILENWTESVNDEDAGNHTYFAVTFKPIAYALDFLDTEYALKAYAITETGEVIYDKNEDPQQRNNVRNTSVYEIAEFLYNNSLMSSESGHKFLYNHVLNIVSIKYNRMNIGTAVMNYLGVTSKDDPNYTLANTLYKDLHYYIWLQPPYKYGKYTDRETFRTLTDGNEEKLLNALNTQAKANGEYDYDHYRSVAQWITENVTGGSGFYVEATYNPATPIESGTVDAGTLE